jgi:protein-tyrosine phosphatase
MSTASANITSILFICMGNICRSPAGENVMRKLLEDANLADVVRCDSAGTIDYHIGECPDRRMIAAGRKRGLPMTGTARQITREDLDSFDLILAMDDANYRAVLKLSNERNRDKVKRFCSYCVRHQDAEVPDPYYGGAAGFEHVLDLLEDGCTQILEAIRRK